MSTETVTSSSTTAAKRVTTQTLLAMRDEETPIAMLTAYDYTSARLLDEAGVDVLLVGDSASNVMAGHETTLPITLDQMIYHAQCVVRGVQRALVVVDLPFGAYQGSSREALRSAIRVMKETGAHAVKLEGGATVLESVKRILEAGIPVMGHLGLTPQSIYKFGTYRVRARDNDEADSIRRDLKRLAKAGVFGVVLEKIPSELAVELTQSVDIPTIGIGAGVGCSGQVLVTHDLLGLTKDFNPRFVRHYADLGEAVVDAVGRYVEDVRLGAFPSEAESY
ncbi:3-methyl-2-oxobutanoate hydroxymethyltransferase [Rubrivirga sp.]|uniref:3-methyl-2-oxobutanoate hydroxymethyltransferase n=1 Tax=Rubrivirga sp. TaxID=1885344 RepID=UPI003C729D29